MIKSASDYVTICGSKADLTVFAHDVRGPLASISLLLESIESLARTGMTDQAVQRARRAQSIADTLNDCLTGMLGRLRSSGDPLEPQIASLKAVDLLMSVKQIYEPTAAQRQMTVHVSSSSRLLVNGDKNLLQQAIGNLLSNAIKYGAAGSGIDCTVRYEVGHVVIEVADRGRTLSDAERMRLFEPYVRLDMAAAAEVPGIGLGLWIVRQIAERHKGDVAVMPRADGNGNVFALRIPAFKSADRNELISQGVGSIASRFANWRVRDFM
jgi:signal transduction histidine kinase